MKQKLYVFSTLCLFSIATVVAQDSDRREKLEFGIKAGLNVSNVWDSKGEEFKADPIAGFAAGAYLGIPIGKYIGIQPEALLSQKGFSASGTLFGSGYSFSRTTTYLDIPLQLQLKPVQFVTLLFGPQFSYLLNQKDEYTFGVTSTLQEQEFKNDNARKNILGFVAGGDIIYKFLVISGRVGWDFQTNVGDGITLTPRYKNRWVQATIGFKI